MFSQQKEEFDISLLFSSPGKTDTLEKNHHRILAMTGYVCTYSVYLCDLNTMQIQNAKAFKL